MLHIGAVEKTVKNRYNEPCERGFDMIEPLFLKPAFQEKIWGGHRLRDEFDYDIPSDKTGECWAISAHPHGESTVKNGKCQGMKLSEVWTNYPDLFGDSKEAEFPLLTKILDAEADLSVQVHPDDEYGKQHAGELGKTECWYIIDAVPGAEIIYGHNAQTKEEFVQMVESGKWDELLRRVPVHKGDFFYVPSGMIHAIGKGIMILETQQSSDTTYRVYDYDRTDDAGNKRELHLQESIDVTTVPQQDPQLAITQQIVKRSSITTFVKTPFFDVYKWSVDGKLHLKATAPYTLVSILDGAGELDFDGVIYELQKGDHLILPNGVSDWYISGKLEAIAATPGSQNR